MTPLALLVFLGSLELEGPFLSLRGQWPAGHLQLTDRGLLIQGREEVFIIDDEHVSRFYFRGYPRCALLFDGLLYIVSDQETVVIDPVTGERRVTHLDLAFLSHDGRRLLAMPSTYDAFDFPDLLLEVEPGTGETVRSFFKQPRQGFPPTRFWLVSLGADQLICLDNEPDRVYVSTEATRGRDATVSRRFPGVTFFTQIGPEARPRRLRPALAVDRPFVAKQDYLAAPNRLFYFGRYREGYLMATEVGIKSPDLDGEVTIGSRLQLTLLDGTLAVRARYLLDGQFVAVRGDRVVLLHNGSRTEKPTAIYNRMFGSPRERAKAMLEDFQRYSLDVLEPILEERVLPEIPD